MFSQPGRFASLQQDDSEEEEFGARDRRSAKEAEEQTPSINEDSAEAK